MHSFIIPTVAVSQKTAFATINPVIYPIPYKGLRKARIKIKNYIRNKRGS